MKAQQSKRAKTAKPAKPAKSAEIQAMSPMVHARDRLMAGLGTSIDGEEGVYYGAVLEDWRVRVKAAGLKWMLWCEETLGIDVRSADRLRRLYRLYRDRAWMLRRISVASAYMLTSGVVAEAAIHEARAIIEMDGRLTYAQAQELSERWRVSPDAHEWSDDEVDEG